MQFWSYIRATSNSSTYPCHGYEAHRGRVHERTCRGFLTRHYALGSNNEIRTSEIGRRNSLRRRSARSRAHFINNSSFSSHTLLSSSDARARWNNDNLNNHNRRRRRRMRVHSLPLALSFLFLFVGSLSLSLSLSLSFSVFLCGSHALRRLVLLTQIAVLVNGITPLSSHTEHRRVHVCLAKREASESHCMRSLLCIAYSVDV